MSAADVGLPARPDAPARLERRGLLLAFGAFGLFWGAWSAVLPDVRDRAGLDDGQLGLALAAVAVAALPAMPLAGRLADRLGPRRLLPGALLVFALVGALLGVAGRPVLLVAALLLLGASTGVLDVVANVATAGWERLSGRRVMSAAHGCFSVGVLVGAALTGLARDVGAGPPLVLGTTGAVIALAALAQPAYRAVPPGDPGAAGPRRLSPVLVGLAAVVAASFLVEDAVQSWSALHLERDLGAGPALSGLGPGLFAGAMAVGRFGAQWLVRPGSDAVVVRVAGAVAAAGALLLGLAPTAALALAGAALTGAGVSVLAPTLLSAVGARSAPGRQGADLAVVTAGGYAGFVLGPPLVGVLSGASSLTTALSLLAVLAGGIAVAGPLLLRPAPRGT